MHLINRNIANTEYKSAPRPTTIRRRVCSNNGFDMSSHSGDPKQYCKENDQEILVHDRRNTSLDSASSLCEDHCRRLWTSSP